MPDVQMPWVSSYWPLAIQLFISSVALAESHCVCSPSIVGRTLMSGYSARAFWKPMWRSVSAGWPAKPRM